MVKQSQEINAQQAQEATNTQLDVFYYKYKNLTIFIDILDVYGCGSRICIFITFFSIIASLKSSKFSLIQL